jgi:hypothetical protein
MGYGTVSVDNLLTSNVGLNINGGYVTANVNSLGAGLIPAEQYYRLDTASTGADVSTAQKVFGVGVTLVGSTVYQFEMVFCLVKTAGTTSHTMGLSFGGTATINNIGYLVRETDGNGSTGTRITTVASIFVASAANTTVTGGLSAATQVNTIRAVGTVSIANGGTFIPQYTLSAAPGGAYSTIAGSYFKIAPLAGAGANVNIGTWA